MPLKTRANSVAIHNKISNIVGQILLDHPGQQFRITEVYALVKDQCDDRYTEGQVRRGLEWQTENNPDFIKARLRTYHYENKSVSRNTRFYWYEPASDI